MNRLKKHSSLLFLLTALLTIIFINLSCEDNPVTPERPPPPGSRNYQWKEYSIKFETDFLQVTNVCALSPTNVWLASAFTTSSAISIIHFDGNKLKADTILGPQPWFVFGIDSQNVWFSTTNSSIWYFNGYNWTKQQNLHVEGYDRVSIQSIWGDSENNLYAVGFAENYSTLDYVGVILKYNNRKWEYLDIPDYRVSFKSVRRDPQTGYLFIPATNYDHGFLEKLFVYDGKNLEEVYSEYGSDPFSEILGNKLVILLNQIIYEYDYSTKQLKEFIDLTGTSLWGGISGRSINDFFAVAIDGIGHYNGTNFETIYKTELSPTGASVLEKDVFFGGTNYDTQESVLIHAKLKEE